MALPLIPSRRPKPAGGYGPHNLPIADILLANEQSLRKAAEAIRRGDLVVMPTETVYGLAADAMNLEAVRRIFAAKGRPAENPLIVHIAGFDEVSKVAAEVPPEAARLAQEFWPGPLTMVLPKRDSVPQEVTAGLDTVALRVPAHPVALALLRACGRPLAAPSANPFTRVSPTRVEHLDHGLLDSVAMVLDAGPCEVGLESTVLDLTNPGRPAILRPGGVSRADIERVIGPTFEPDGRTRVRSPGSHPRHYAPRTPVKLVDLASPEAAALVLHPPSGDRQVRMPDDPALYGAKLYAALHEMDRLGAEEIEIELPPRTPEWEAVQDRLRRAVG